MTAMVVAGSRRKVTYPVKPTPKGIASGHRRIVVESVGRQGGKVTLEDFAHGRTRLTAGGRRGYDYRGAGGALSPKQLAAARRNLERARAAKKGR